VPYTQPTLTEAQIALASRLNDTGFIRWLAPELAGYLREALRTWQSWTTFYRDQGSFATVATEPFYDLPTQLPTLRGYTVTNWELVTDLQYALLEPAPAGGTWTGTDQFTLDQLTTAIQRRRDQFLRETGCVITRTVTAMTPPASGRIPLDEAVSIVRRVAWRPDATMLTTPLTRATEWAANNWSPGWLQSTQQPYAYSVTTVPPLTLQLIPPTAAGTLDLLSINTGTALDPTVASLLAIPDDFVWVVKWGALADLLNGDGLALDSQRAAYCEARWQQGLDLARRFSVVLAAQINGVACRIGAVSDADSYSPVWQMVPGVPIQPLLVGQNLVAIWPPPRTFGNPWTITLDVVPNVPVPVNPGDILQISQDVYDSILDYAQHLALFKEGDGELEAAMGLLDRASRAAGITLQFHQAAHPDRAAILGQGQQDRRSQPEQLAEVVAIPVED